MKVNIAWRGTKPQYIGVGDNLRWVTETGVATIHSEKEYDDFAENMSVSYGEQGGDFKIMFAWQGNIRGDAIFFSGEELYYYLGGRRN